MNNNKTPGESISRKRRFNSSKKVSTYTVGIIAVIVLLIGGWYGYAYVSTPQHIRKPSYQHYHFRTQILVDGKAVDFSKEEFQVESGKSISCSAEVGSIPIDFHDKMDQLTHVHWSGMTGGEFIKYYGLNLLGGNDEVLGQRYDDGIMPKPVKIYGKLLPSVPDETSFYIYIGDKNGYQQKNWDDFLNQDLETFFGKKSNTGQSEEESASNVLNWLFPKVSAHGGVVDEHSPKKSEEELTRINNLIGNVTIFVQQKEPTKEQVTARFDNLVPLHESTCGD